MTRRPPSHTRRRVWPSNPRPRWSAYLGQPYFDHLPFGIWPIAAAQAVNPRAVIPLHALFSVLTVALVGVTAHRVKGPWAALAAMLVLATSQFYFFQTSYPTLDPLLLLLTTASVLPVIAGQGTRRGFVLAWLFAALAVAVKGPFGLLPLGGALGARVLVDRSWRHLGWGALVFILAAAPVALFLSLRPDWREGYGVGQLLASATGARVDRLLMARPCVLATDFSEELMKRGDPVAVVSAQHEWDVLSALAFERDVRPRRVASWDEATENVAMATEAAWASAPPQWSARSRARGWILATRSP